MTLSSRGERLGRDRARRHRSKADNKNRNWKEVKYWTIDFFFFLVVSWTKAVELVWTKACHSRSTDCGRFSLVWTEATGLNLRGSAIWQGVTQEQVFWAFHVFVEMSIYLNLWFQNYTGFAKLNPRCWASKCTKIFRFIALEVTYSQHPRNVFAAAACY